MIFENDIAMLPTYALYFLFCMVLLMTSIIAHETGHALWFKLIQKKKIKLFFEYTNIWKMKFKAGELADYETLTDEEYVQVNVSGVVIGAIPIFIAGLYFFPLWLMYVPYLVGCIPDLKEIFANIKEDPKDED